MTLHNTNVFIMKNFFILPLLLLLSTFWGCSESSTPDTVIDRSGLLDPSEISTLAEYNAALLRDHDIDFRLVLEDANLQGVTFNSRANALMEELAETTQSAQGRLILLYIDAGSDLSRLEISGDLEGVYTDIFSGYIQQQHMVYFFREQRIQDGILAASEMVYERARDASLGHDFSVPVSVMAGGGGATAEARISNNAVIPKRASRISSEELQAGSTPMETVMLYKLSMAAGNTDPDKDIFTDATQAMMRQWTVTPAQQRNGVKGIERCAQFPSQIIYSENGERAVIRYPTEERQCNPWFLQKGAGKWRLDLNTMQQAIGFNQKNQYHFRNQTHAYTFAFTDLRFDTNGFPFE